jgi:hypothetical protein
VNYPLKIYKYRNFQTPFHLRLISHQEIFFARPGDLNDPFDCRIPIQFWSGTEAELREYFTELADKEIGYNREMADWKLKHIEKRIKEKPKTELEQREDEFRLTAQTVSNYGVFSASRKPLITPVWAHYASNHTGFCVGINLQKLERFVETREAYNDNTFPVFSPSNVTYLEKLPIINPFKPGRYTQKELELCISAKHVRWEYEEETRLISTDPDLATRRAIKLDIGIIDEIYYGMAIDKYDRMRIHDIIIEKKLPIQEFQVKMNYGTFDLAAEPYIST